MCLLNWDLRNNRLALDLSERNYSVTLYMYVKFRPKLQTVIIYRTVWSSCLPAAETHCTVCVLYLLRIPDVRHVTYTEHVCRSFSCSNPV
jgi:hypothetical protein